MILFRLKGNPCVGSNEGVAYFDPSFYQELEIAESKSNVDWCKVRNRWGMHSVKDFNKIQYQFSYSEIGHNDLYVEFRKALDKINNDILLSKSCASGFPPGLLSTYEPAQ